MFQLHVVNQHYAVQMHQRSEIKRSDGLSQIGLVLTFWKKAETLSCRCRYDRRYMTGYVCLLKCMKLQSMHTGDILCRICVDFIVSFFYRMVETTQFQYYDPKKIFENYPLDSEITTY